MAENASNSSRIAKNSLALYLRMFFTMAVGLYTSRVILDALGVDDYGIYSLVGGFVSMFSVVQSGLVSASQRFINFSLGIGDKEELRHTFSTIVLIYILLTIVALVLVESFGVYFLEKQLNIPNERLYAAKWTFNLSAIILVGTLIGAPYNALIVAHERMQTFAYISIIDAILKLVIAELIYFTEYDKLIVYSLLLCLESLLIPALYWIYCKIHFEESKIQWSFDWKLIKKIYSFAIWSMFGGLAYIGFTQGLNVILGMFFAPSIVASRGIAIQVQGVVKNFAYNFQTAVNPQIIKSYAKKEFDYFEKLLLISSKYSFVLLFMLSLPLFFETDCILDLWLIAPPQDSALFLRLILVTILFDCMTTPYERAIHASGNISRYSITTSLTFLAIVPVSYVVLKLGAKPVSVFVIHLVFTIVAAIIRMIMAKRIVHIDLSAFAHRCIFSAAIISISSSVIPVILHFVLPEGTARLVLVFFASIISVVICTICFGMTTPEKEKIMSIIKSKFAIS